MIKLNRAIGSNLLTNFDGIDTTPSEQQAVQSIVAVGDVVTYTPTPSAEISTDTLIVDYRYKITATEVNHFYVGCAINDYFTADATTALDASNKVLSLGPATGFQQIAGCQAVWSN